MRHVNAPLAFSRKEIWDVTKAWLAISLAFTIFFVRTGFGSTDLSILFLISLCTAGIGFVVHELLHKVAAWRFRVHGEFRSNDFMLLIAVVFAFFGVIFAAPGAVYMSGNITVRENGIISAAGPLSNVVIALLFLPLWLLGTGTLATAGFLGFLINAFLGMFNMIPFLGLDGQKVFRWNKFVYFTILVISGLMVVIGYAA